MGTYKVIDQLKPHPDPKRKELLKALLKTVPWKLPAKKN